MICPNCQHECGDSDRFCEHCGAPLTQTTPVYTEVAPIEKKKTYWPFIVGGVVILLAIALALTFFLGNLGKGNAVAHCSSLDNENLQIEYTAYGAEDKINKVVVHIQEKDDSGIFEEEDVQYIDNLLGIEAQNAKREKGINFDYSVNMKDNILVVDATVTIDVNQVSDDYLGSLYVPFDPEWKLMSVDEFKEYIELWQNIPCE